MSVTATVIASTQNMLRYLITTTAEGGELATLVQSALVAAASPGPLKSLLEAPLFQPDPGPGPNPNDWSHLHTDSRLVTSLTPYGLSTVIGASYAYNTASGNALQVQTTDGGSVILELRFENTIVR